MLIQCVVAFFGLNSFHKNIVKGWPASEKLRATFFTVMPQGGSHIKLMGVHGHHPIPPSPVPYGAQVKAYISNTRTSI